MNCDQAASPRSRGQPGASTRPGQGGPGPDEKHGDGPRRVGEATAAASSNVKEAVTVQSHLKGLMKAVATARQFEAAGGVASAAESAEVSSQEIITEAKAWAAARTTPPAAQTLAAVQGGNALETIGHEVESGIGAIGLVAGGAQTIFGGAELEKGQYLKGSGDVLGGAFNLAAGASQVSPAVSSTLATVLRAIGVAADVGGRIPAAGPLVGVASVITGGVQIAAASALGNIESVATGGVEMSGGAIMIAGAFADGTIVGAPAGLVLNAVGGVMILGATAYEHWQALGEGAAWVGSHVASGVSETGRLIRAGAREACNLASSGVSKVEDLFGGQKVPRS